MEKTLKGQPLPLFKEFFTVVRDGLTSCLEIMEKYEREKISEEQCLEQLFKQMELTDHEKRHPKYNILDSVKFKK